MKWVNRTVQRLESHASSPWYPFALGFVALIDNFIFVIPMVPVLITSVFLTPKRWFSFAFFQAIGSSLGVLLFSLVISVHGTHFIQAIAPNFMEGDLWHHAEVWVAQYGLWALFGTSVLPITDHPVIAILALHKVSSIDVMLINFFGKIIKYLVFSWLASHAPKTLMKLKVIKKAQHDFPEG